MKIALCFWGLARSTDWTIQSIEEMIWKSLEDAGIEYDTFVHSYTLERPYTNSRAGEWNLEPKNDIWKMLLPTHYQIEDQDKVDKKLGLKNYRTHGDPWEKEGRFAYIRYSTLDNLVRMLYSLQCVTQLWKKNMLFSHYDAIVYLRPDVRFLTPLKPEWFSNLQDSEIRIPSFHLCEGWNDRFAIGKPKAMELYGQRLIHALNYSKNHPLHSETFLAFLMKQYRIQPTYIPMLFRRIRSDGSVCPGDMEITD